MKVIIVVREIGGIKPDYSLEFESAIVPTIGSYISIARPDAVHGHTEDMIVRRVWWRLHHPETSGHTVGQPKVGSVVDIQVECEQAVGPHSRDNWRATLDAARDRGVAVEEFELSRYAVSEADLNS